MSKRRKPCTRCHGAFKSKARAVRKEQEVGGYIRKVKMRGVTRYLVLTGK
jgi:hypothetical protein